MRSPLLALPPYSHEEQCACWKRCSWRPSVLSWATRLEIPFLSFGGVGLGAKAASAGRLFHHWILERHTLPVVLAEPLSRGILIGEYLEMVLVTDLLSGVDVNPNRHFSP